jgi:hypothetical protein
LWRKRSKRVKQKEGRERREGRTRIERIGVPWAVKASTGTSAHIAARRLGLFRDLPLHDLITL